MTYNEIEHHGILGQKWGVRRFQNEDGSYTHEGKIRYGRLKRSSKNKNYKTETKKQKNKNEDLKKLSSSKKNEIKSKILADPNTKDLYKYRELFSDQELNSAYNRIILQEKIKNEKIRIGKEKLEKIVKTVSLGAAFTTSAYVIATKGSELANMGKDSMIGEIVKKIFNK